VLRWADDFIIGFQLASDAERVKAVLPNRFSRFGLELHPDKTALVKFGRPSMSTQRRRGVTGSVVAAIRE
jgi:RNA-directed DNA polymerase